MNMWYNQKPEINGRKKTCEFYGKKVFLKIYTFLKVVFTLPTASQKPSHFYKIVSNILKTNIKLFGEDETIRYLKNDLQSRVKNVTFKWSFSEKYFEDMI